MLKTLALSASAIAFAGGLAFAETSSLSTGNWLASDVYKADVYDPSEHKVGKVTDLMIDSNGNVTAAIIGVGGFIGVGQKDVAIPFKELQVSTRDGKDWLVLYRTKDELKLAPAYDKKAEMNKM
jgi:sporulation protein YlmC with PRC-barrel domain